MLVLAITAVSARVGHVIKAELACFRLELLECLHQLKLLGGWVLLSRGREGGSTELDGILDDA